MSSDEPLAGFGAAAVAAAFPAAAPEEAAGLVMLVEATLSVCGELAAAAAPAPALAPAGAAALLVLVELLGLAEEEGGMGCTSGGTSGTSGKERISIATHVKRR